MSSTTKLDSKSNVLSRRRMLGALTTVGAASVLPGCDSDPMGVDAGPSDTGPSITDAEPVDAGPSLPIQPSPRTYNTFEHGVASGDPLANAVILWTRVTPGQPDDPVPASISVDWEMSTDSAFSTIAAMGNVTTDAAHDFTVKVDAGRHDAMTSGLSPETTYYYRFRANGDISPIGRTRTAPETGGDHLRFAICSCASLAHGYFTGYRRIAERFDLDAVLHLGDYIYEYGTGEYGDFRAYEPDHEILSLENYRLRYSQYRRDPDLAEAHRQLPFIVIWDDHESADDAWRDGAINHNRGEGEWHERLATAKQAHREWMPYRETPIEGFTTGQEGQIWRALKYGTLVDLFMLDTRIDSRDEQMGLGDAVNDPNRQLLGPDQEAWLFNQIQNSTSQWRILGQQVVVAARTIPNEDAWDGYPAARDRLYNALRASHNVCVVTGDVHTSWAIDLVPADATYDPATGAGSVGVEMVAPGITAPGLSEGAAILTEALVDASAPVKWADLTKRGYLILDIKHERIQADWFLLESITDPTNQNEVHSAGFTCQSGSAHFVEVMTTAPPKDDTPTPAPTS